jgi:hypothetical protein
MMKALKDDKRAKDIRTDKILSKDLPNKLLTATPPMETTPLISSGVAA